MTSEVVPGLYRLLSVGAGVNAYLWRPQRATRAQTILFDCGYPWLTRKVAAELDSLNCSPRQIGAIAITHDDIDHAGTLRWLLAAGVSDVAAHTLEAPRLAAGSWRQPPHLWRTLGLLRPAAGRIYARAPHPPVAVTMPLNDGDSLADGWFLVHTPGHTAGHASFYNPEHRILIAGDALGASRSGKKLRLSMRIFTEDQLQEAASIRKLALLQPYILCPGHGGIMRNAAGHLQHFADAGRLSTRQQGSAQ
jgi:glyoxylase-like metal-dependent hydrolase (beta-lactamase superfamily II)